MFLTPGGQSLLLLGLIDTLLTLHHKGESVVKLQMY